MSVICKLPGPNYANIHESEFTCMSYNDNGKKQAILWLNYIVDYMELMLHFSSYSRSKPFVHRNENQIHKQHKTCSVVTFVTSKTAVRAGLLLTYLLHAILEI